MIANEEHSNLVRNLGVSNNRVLGGSGGLAANAPQNISPSITPFSPSIQNAPPSTSSGSTPPRSLGTATYNEANSIFRGGQVAILDNGQAANPNIANVSVAPIVPAYVAPVYVPQTNSGGGGGGGGDEDSGAALLQDGGADIQQDNGSQDVGIGEAQDDSTDTNSDDTNSDDTNSDDGFGDDFGSGLANGNFTGLANGGKKQIYSNADGDGGGIGGSGVSDADVQSGEKALTSLLATTKKSPNATGCTEPTLPRFLAKKKWEAYDECVKESAAKKASANAPKPAGKISKPAPKSFFSTPAGMAVGVLAVLGIGAVVYKKFIA